MVRFYPLLLAVAVCLAIVPPAAAQADGERVDPPANGEPMKLENSHLSLPQELAGLALQGGFRYSDKSHGFSLRYSAGRMRADVYWYPSRNVISDPAELELESGKQIRETLKGLQIMGERGRYANIQPGKIVVKPIKGSGGTPMAFAEMTASLEVIGDAGAGAAPNKASSYVGILSLPGNSLKIRVTYPQDEKDAPKILADFVQAILDIAQK